MYLLSYIALLIIIAAFNIESLTIPPAFFTVAILYFLSMPSSLLSSATISYMFDKQETARQFYPGFAMAFGICAYNIVSLVDMLGSGKTDPWNAGTILHFVFSFILPMYIPFGLLYYINKIYILCSQLGKNCGDLSLDDYMTKEIAFMYFVCLFNCVFYYLALRIADAVKLGGSFKDAIWLNVSSFFLLVLTCFND